jgi:hypothetical protein
VFPFLHFTTGSALLLHELQRVQHVLVSFSTVAPTNLLTLLVRFARLLSLPWRRPRVESKVSTTLLLQLSTLLLAIIILL